MTRAWTLISIAEGRQYGGNLGYADDLRAVYRFDSAVSNHLRMGPGDLVFVRDRTTVLGIARIAQITSAQGSKRRLRCPECNTTAIKERTNVVPKWRCDNSHTFETPIEEDAAVTAYSASYDRTFLDLNGAISVADLRRAARRPSDQLSIEEIDASKIAELVVSAVPASRSLIAHFLQSTQPDPAGDEIEADRDDTDYQPSFADTRARINRSIALRRGQQAFRNKLIRRYGSTCMITGCQLLEIIEAAHIWPFRGNDDNHPENGILLRADVHTLFDLDLLGIDPSDLSVRLHPAALNAGYDHLEGTRLHVSSKIAPSASALRERWTSFRNSVGAWPPDNTSATDAPPSARAYSLMAP